MVDSTDITEKTEQQLQALSEALESGTLHHAKGMLNALHPAEIAHLLESLPSHERLVIWPLVSKDLEAEVLINLGDEIRHGLIKDMSPEQLVEVAEDLEVDDSADFVQSLPDSVIDQVLHSLDSQHRKMLESVLSFPEDSAGGMMNTDTITVRPEVTLDVVLRYLRLLGDIPKPTDHLIVVDRDNRYLGILALSELLINEPENTVEDIMDDQVTAIPSDMEDNDVAMVFEDLDLISAPVVDGNNMLLGRITVDDVVDVIREEADHSVLSMAGLNDEEDLFSPVLPSSRRRAIWLGINLITAFMASWVVSNFETTLERVVTVAILMNVVASMGGIAGSQTITLVIRSMALGQFARNNRWWVFNKEVMVGLFNGLIWAVVVALIATFWFDDYSVGLVIAAALIINLIFAAASGVAIPIILKKLHIDPAIAGSVILTTITDIVGLLAFLGLATIFLL
ncbi:MAG: magnesium transporter [endosymbiont of Galathealinum brachiosum]|uniref:Magnesium transporter MgtE n=1 Tax=endosymbiont of Galathealinum brachiosum TaxID=2200906 RepID=A0A370DAQ2_9GAMM|nr:MAG: magnesium transporter [endosymbiont of Galathealinum brachiosum]